MYTVTTTMINYPDKMTPGINIIRLGYHVEVINLDDSFGD